MAGVIEYGSIITDAPLGIEGRRVIAQPINQGFSKKVREKLQNLSLGAGNNTLSGSFVPAGYMWAIENIYIQYNGTTAGVTLSVQINDGGTTYKIFELQAPVNAQGYDRQLHLTVAEGENIILFIGGATAGDDAFIQYTGRAIALNE